MLQFIKIEVTSA